MDDPFFAAEADSPAGASLTEEQREKEAETALLGSDDSMADAGAESLFKRVAGAPLTLWTIPEISSVGFTEDQALAEGMKLAANGGSL